MKIVLKLAAALAEYLPSGVAVNADAGGAVEVEVEVDVEGSVTANGLIARYGLPREEAQVVMVNGEFVPPSGRDAALRDGDEVSVWPSIQGG